MKTSLAKVHPIIVVPVVVLLWLVGSTALLFLASALNLPGINEHGPGALIAFATWLLALVVGSFHSLVIIRRNRWK